MYYGHIYGVWHCIHEDSKLLGYICLVFTFRLCKRAYCSMAGSTVMTVRANMLGCLRCNPMRSTLAPLVCFVGPVLTGLYAVTNSFGTFNSVLCNLGKNLVYHTCMYGTLDFCPDQTGRN